MCLCFGQSAQVCRVLSLEYRKPEGSRVKIEARKVKPSWAVMKLMEWQGPSDLEAPGLGWALSQFQSVQR